MIFLRRIVFWSIRTSKCFSTPSNASLGSPMLKFSDQIISGLIFSTLKFDQIWPRSSERPESLSVLQALHKLWATTQFSRQFPNCSLYEPYSVNFAPKSAAELDTPYCPTEFSNRPNTLTGKCNSIQSRFSFFFSNARTLRFTFYEATKFTRKFTMKLHFKVHNGLRFRRQEW